MSYNIEWRDTATLTTTQVLGIADLFYDLAGLNESTEYEFRVQEDDGTTTSAWTTWKIFTTAADAGLSWYTATLPLTTSLPNFIATFKTADFPAEMLDGRASGFIDGGGNAIPYTDDTLTTRLPMEVVRCVTGVSPDVEIHVRHPTATTGSTVHWVSSRNQTVQPTATATYGRNAVWIDYLAVVHGGSTVDSSGNFSSGTPLGSPTIGTGPYGWGKAYQLDGVNDYIQFPSTVTNPVPVHVSVLVKLNSNPTGTQLVVSMGNEADTGMWVNAEENTTIDGYTDSYDICFANKTTLRATGNNTAIAGETSHIAATVGGFVYLNGVAGQAVPSTTNTENKSFKIGGPNGFATGYIHADIGEVRVSDSFQPTPEWTAAEYDNLSTTTAWVTVGTWGEEGGSGGLIYEEAITAGTALDFNRSNTASLSSTMSSSISISTQLENNISIDSNIAYQWLLDANNTSNITANNNLLSNIDLTVDYFSNIAVQDSIIENTNLTESYLNSAIISAAVEEALSADTALTANLVVKEALEAQSSFNAYYNYGGIVEEVLISSISADYNLSNRITAENINSEALNVDVITSNNITKDINIQENIINNVLLTVGNLFEVSLTENVNTALTTQQNYIINETITSNLSLEDQIANRVSVIDSLTFENKVTVQYISNIIQDLNITEAVVTDVIVEGSRVKLYLSLPSKRTLTLSVESRVLTINKEDRVLKF